MYKPPIRDGHKYINKDLITNYKYLLIKHNKENKIQTTGATNCIEWACK